jgi:hypothetical protein
MPDTLLSGNVVKKALPLALVAVGLGWLLYTQRAASAPLAKRARDLGHSLRQQLDGAMPALRQTPRPVVRRKLAVEEPMAGYGAQA